MMCDQHDVPTPYVRKIIPLCELAPLAVLICGYLAYLADSPIGYLALGLFAGGMLTANFLRDCCEWYNARHPDETGR
jgi:hypothetical protein